MAVKLRLPKVTYHVIGHFCSCRRFIANTDRLPELYSLSSLTFDHGYKVENVTRKWPITWWVPFAQTSIYTHPLLLVFSIHHPHLILDNWFQIIQIIPNCNIQEHVTKETTSFNIQPTTCHHPSQFGTDNVGQPARPFWKTTLHHPPTAYILASVFSYLLDPGHSTMRRMHLCRYHFLPLIPEIQFFSRGQIWRSQLTLSRSIEQAISTAYTTDAHNQVVCKGSISTCS